MNETIAINVVMFVFGFILTGTIIVVIDYIKSNRKPAKTICTRCKSNEWNLYFCMYCGRKLREVK